LLALSVESACGSVARITGEKMKSDSDIKRDAEAELKWDPQIDPSDIAVAVKDGVVTLIALSSSAPHIALATIFLDAREADDKIAVPTSKANQ
jgi:osmotically-inducible protein OsmY